MGGFQSCASVRYYRIIAHFQKYQTKKHLKENDRIRRKGFYGNQRARNEDGYTSLRDTKQFHEIGHHLRLSTEWAQNPGHDPRFFKRPRLSGKVKMFFVNKGIDLTTILVLV